MSHRRIFHAWGCQVHPAATSLRKEHTDWTAPPRRPAGGDDQHLSRPEHPPPAVVENERLGGSPNSVRGASWNCVRDDGVIYHPVG